MTYTTLTDDMVKQMFDDCLASFRSDTYDRSVDEDDGTVFLTTACQFYPFSMNAQITDKIISIGIRDYDKMEVLYLHVCNHVYNTREEVIVEDEEEYKSYSKKFTDELLFMYKLGVFTKDLATDWG